MALFGSGKDIDLFRSINHELIGDIIETVVDVFKISLEKTPTNVYGESDEKIYMTPYRLECLIRSDDQNADYNDLGIVDKKQTSRFAFVRDQLKELECYLEVGDLIHWNNKYWEIDEIRENQLYMKRNPETNKQISDLFGWDVAISVSAHITKRNIPMLEETRSGIK